MTEDDQSKDARGGPPGDHPDQKPAGAHPEPPLPDVHPEPLVPVVRVEPGVPAVRAEPAVPVVRRRGRRVTTDAAPGSDPTPAPVDRRSDRHDNDDRLRADVPPHWG